jgi:hypothetical protein
MGKSLDSGRFSSMVPHACPGESLLLSGMGVGLQALTGLAVFGIWYEQRTQRKLQQAQWEERRVNWLDSILNQWIAEHSEIPGVAVDATLALQREVEKLTDALIENAQVEIPEIIHLKLERVSNYIDELDSKWSMVLSLLGDASDSDPIWRDIPSMSSEQLAQETLEELADETQFRINDIWQGVMGLAAGFVPVVGPAIAGGTLGWLVGDISEKRNLRKRIDRISEYPQLLRINFAVDQLMTTRQLVDVFFNEQELPADYRLYGTTRGLDMDAELRLGPSWPSAWYRRPFVRFAQPRLLPVPSPLELAAA